MCFLPIKCPQEVLVAFDLWPCIFGCPFSLNVLQVQIPDQYAWHGTEFEASGKKKKNCHGTQFCNFSLNDSLTRRLEIKKKRYKFSYFLSPPKFITRVAKSGPYIRANMFGKVRPLTSFHASVSVYAASWAWVTIVLYNLAKLSLSLSQWNYLKLTIQLILQSLLGCGRCLLFLFLGWLTYIRTFYHFVWKLSPCIIIWKRSYGLSIYLPPCSFTQCAQ